MRILWPVLATISITVVCCGLIQGILSIFISDAGYIPPPATFTEADLVGTWQANYGFTNTDTITLKADGTYQQVFKAPEINYYYESPWNEWFIEYSLSGKPKLHLEGMRYYAAAVEIGENGGEFPKGNPILFYDMDEDELIEMANKVILAINGDDDSPRGIILWHMQFDPDDGPEFFVLTEE